jgi:acetyl esterase/lipase
LRQRPHYLIDAKQVIAWARRNADHYGGDPSRIYVAGSSAGGHVAVTSAFTPNQPDFEPGFGDVDTSVAGAISLYGFYGSPDSEPGVEAPRDSWRLQPLRGWSNAQPWQVPPRDP